MLYRGTTPYHSFTLPLPIDKIDLIYITYLQNGEIILEKEKSDVTFAAIDSNGFIIDKNHGDEIKSNDYDYESEEISNACLATVHLTQEDTLKFKFYPAAEKNITAIQIRVLDTDGEAYDSDVIHERIYGALKDGVIGAEEVDNGEELQD